MLSWIKNYFYDRASKSKRVHPIYIIPTLDGIKVLALNLTLLIIGLVYANNYVLLFNFIFFCLFLSSMFYTHFNLSGLTLRAAHFPSLHVNEDGVLTLSFSSKNTQGHYFIRPYFKSAIAEINEVKETFPIPFREQSTIKISIKGKKRGQESIQAIYIETLFPLNFFRCFTFFPINQDFYVYPERSDLKIHEEVEVTEDIKIDADDYFIRNYQIGDSLKRVDWKKLAQTNRWYTREFQGQRPSPILLILDQKSIKEDALKSVCYAIHNLHQQDIKYGLKLGQKVFISPENSSVHLGQCLRELAIYET